MMCDYFHSALSIVCADGLMILNARTSRGILMTMWILFIYPMYFEGETKVSFETHFVILGILQTIASHPSTWCAYMNMLMTICQPLIDWGDAGVGQGE